MGQLRNHGQDRQDRDLGNDRGAAQHIAGLATDPASGAPDHPTCADQRGNQGQKARKTQQHQRQGPENQRQRQIASIRPAR